MVLAFIYIYIYILYDLEFNWFLDFSVFVPNNLLATKIKNLVGHLAENWIPIEIQFRI